MDARPLKLEEFLDVATLTGELFQLARRKPSLEIVSLVQRELIVNALDVTSGNYSQAAELLGITRSTLRKRVRKFAIKEEFLAY